MKYFHQYNYSLHTIYGQGLRKYPYKYLCTESILDWQRMYWTCALRWDKSVWSDRRSILPLSKWNLTHLWSFSWNLYPTFILSFSLMYSFLIYALQFLSLFVQLSGVDLLAFGSSIHNPLMSFILHTYIMTEGKKNLIQRREYSPICFPSYSLFRWGSCYKSIAHVELSS